MIRSEIEASSCRHSTGKRPKEFSLDHAILVVPLLWPRIGKQYQHLGDADLRRKALQKFPGLGLKKPQVLNPGDGLLTRSLSQTVAQDVDSNKEAIGIQFRVLCQEMAMAASDFPGNRTDIQRNVCPKCLLERSKAGLHPGKIRWIRGRTCRSQAWRIGYCWIFGRPKFITKDLYPTCCASSPIEFAPAIRVILLARNPQTGGLRLNTP